MASSEVASADPSPEEAIRSGNVAQLLSYLDRGGDPDAMAAPRRSNLLHKAVCAAVNRRAMAALLLQRGARVDGSDGAGYSALHYACDSRSATLDFDVIQLLLDAGANVNHPSWDGCTPLSEAIACHARLKHDRAAQERQMALIRLLLAHGAAPREWDRDLWQQVFVAIESLEIAELVIAGRGFDVRELRQPIRFARSPAMVDFVIERGADIHERDPYDGRTALHWAAFRGEVALMFALLRHGADIDAADENGGRPMHHACFEGKLALMEWEPVKCSLAAYYRDGLPYAVESLRRTLASLGKPLPPLTAWLKWLVTALREPLEPPPYGPANVYSSRPSNDRPTMTRDEILKPLKDRAWEKRKHLVCCYFETRRIRREAAAKK